MSVSSELRGHTFAAWRFPIQILVWMTCLLSAGTLSSQTLHGFVLTGNPASASGATWTYRDTVNGVIYDLAGVLFKPAGTSKLPAVVLSHGHLSNVTIFTTPIAKEMRNWGLVGTQQSPGRARRISFEPASALISSTRSATSIRHASRRTGTAWEHS
jgi:hypothetical protein